MNVIFEFFNSIIQYMPKVMCTVAKVKLTFSDNSRRLLIVFCMQSSGFEVLEHIFNLHWI